MTLPRSAYPPDWEEIVAEIRERSKDENGIPRCECTGECSLHRTTGGPRRCVELHGHPAKWARGKVILTTAHLCNDSTCDRRDHLIAACQRCHLRIDTKFHVAQRKKNQEQRVGQRRLFVR